MWILSIRVPNIQFLLIFHLPQSLANSPQLLGGTGSGKSTLLNLIPRFMDVSSGEVIVNGVNVRDQDLEALWAQIGYVPQRAMLFRGTVRDNLKYGKTDATDEEIWQALETAQAKDFINELPEKLDAQVAQGGSNFSGGQRQRLAIARALIRKPQIYILDDSFSALDYTTDAKLRQALHETAAHATLIVIAQRISTILSADQIIVLDEGKIVGAGKHSELMESCPTYKEIVLSQLSPEEAA
jgi:ATP-binding cassette subfamily B protein